jgi:predicted HTH transcriptional regulator
VVVVLEENLLLGEMFQIQEVLVQEHLEILLHNQQEAQEIRHQHHHHKEILEEVKQVVDMVLVLEAAALVRKVQMVQSVDLVVLREALVVMVHHHLSREHQ